MTENIIDPINPDHLMPSGACHPFQDKFNQVHLFFGMTKLEHISSILLAAIMSQPVAWAADPRRYAEIATDYATELLDACKNIAEITSKAKGSQSIIK